MILGDRGVLFPSPRGVGQACSLTILSSKNAQDQIDGLLAIYQLLIPSLLTVTYGVLGDFLSCHLPQILTPMWGRHTYDGLDGARHMLGYTTQPNLRSRHLNS